MALFPNIENCVYTSCYCEENVWCLCNAVRENKPDDLNNCYCVFISNNDRLIPLWEQKASTKDDGLVVWDYHVIFLHIGDNGCVVYDLDSKLEFPCEILRYIKQGIQSCARLQPKFRRLFRVIPAGVFLEKFASDRSHMLDSDKQWIKPPPDYLCIQTDASTNNIQDFISMESSVGFGEVMDLSQFCDTFLKRDVS